MRKQGREYAKFGVAPRAGRWLFLVTARGRWPIDILRPSSVRWNRIPRKLKVDLYGRK